MNIYEQLTMDGWNECPNQLKPGSRCFYKRFATPTRCNENDSKPGVQVELSVVEYQGRTMVAIELVAGLKDGTWMKLQNYCLPSDLAPVYLLIPRLLAIWEAANNFPDQPVVGTDR